METRETLAALEAMSNFLASKSTFQFESEIQYDAVQTTGQKIEFGSQRKFAFSAPDRARIDALHWDGNQELVIFDGDRVSAAIPALQVYATSEYKGSIGDAFDYLESEYGLAAPLVDLLRPSIAAEIEDRVLSARRLGRVTIRGTPCDQLAFRGEDIDFQLFIREGPEPVPVRLIIDYHSASGQPQFRAQLSGWNFASALTDSFFTFVPSAGAQRVEFTELLDLLLGPVDEGEGR